MDTNTFPKKSTVTDPVCGMEINAASAAGRSDHAGESYFFCSTSCQEKFDGNPAKYVGRSAKPVVPTTAHDGGGHSCCSHAPKAETTVKDPVCGMDVDPSTAAGSFEHAGPDLLLLQQGLPGEVPGRPGPLPEPGPCGHGPASTSAETLPGGTTLHLPDAPGDRPGQARGAARSAAWRSSRSSPRRTTGRTPSSIDMTRRFWVCLVADRPAARARDGRDGARPAARLSGPRARSGSSSRSRRRSSSGAGWPFFERGWASLVNRSLNMFTLIALGTGDGLPLQRRRDALPGPLPALVPRPRRDGRRSTSRRRRSSRRWCSSARCSSSGPGARPSSAIKALLGLAPEDGPAARRRRPRGGRPARAGPGRRPAPRPARREGARSTASSSKARAPSTSRW